MIDGSHVYQTALLDFVGVDSMLDVGGYVALDDVSPGVSGQPNLDGGPNRLLATVLSTGRYEVTPVNHNVVLCRKTR